MGSELLMLCDFVHDTGAGKIIYIVLGAILAMLGGLLTQKYQNYVLKGREDRESLLKALEILIDIRPSLNGLTVPPSDLIEPCKRVLPSAMRIRTRHYHRLAVELIEFALKPNKHTKEEADKLIDEISRGISKPYYGYNRKENEFFKKAAKEMREGLDKNEGREK